jgi:invasion protein IalB
MKKHIKQIFFVISGLAIAAIFFTLTKLDIASAAKKDGKKFRDWTVTCSYADQENKKLETCALTQQIDIVQDEKKQRAALFHIGYYGPKKELRLVAILPLGVSLEAGTSIVSSKKFIAPGKYVTCLASGCQSVAYVSEEDLKILLSNEESSMACMNLEGNQITFPLSTKGLKEGLNFIR